MRIHISTIIGTAMFAVLLTATACFAATVTFPSGETVDISVAQLNLLKRQQGLYYVGYPHKELIPTKTTERVVVEVPDELGGGFLIGFPKDFQKGLEAIKASGASVIEEEPPGQAPTGHAIRPETNPPVRFEFGLDGSYRIDRLKWNIAGNSSGSNPNILSELTWTDLRMFQLELSNTTIIKKRVYLRGYVVYGEIYSGDNQDSDYAGDDRTIEFSRSNNSTDDGDALDGSIAAGYRFTFGSDRFELIPLIGYSYHELNLNITDGYQTIPATGSFPGLDSTYDTRWHGPWTGIDFKVNTRPRNSLIRRGTFFTTLEVHYADYYAEADWNLRTNLAHPKSFEHDAEAFGILFKIGGKLYFATQWALNISYDYAYWETGEGTDRTFAADGSTGVTQLNEVIWQSHVLSLGIVYQF